jgi:hypothetical protein
MAWEHRSESNHPYYYTGRRIGGRRVKIYHGRGQAAVKAAQRVADARAARQADHAAAQALAQELEPLDQAGVELDRKLTSLTQAALLSTGLRCHHGMWRRPRAQHNRQSSIPA